MLRDDEPVDEPVTDQAILDAMTQRGDSFAVARNIIVLFAKQIGRIMSDREFDEAALHLLSQVKLPLVRRG